MSATLNDLRAALDDVADRAAPPQGVDVLYDVVLRVTAARRRRIGSVAVLAAAAMTAAAVGVLAAQPDQDTTLPAHKSADVATVVEDPSFPAFTLGLRRIVVVELALARGTSAPLTPKVDATRPLWAVATCPASGEPTGFTLTSGSRQVVVPCAGPDGPAARTSRKLLWAPADASPRLDVTWAATTRPGARARLALYQESTWEEYRLPQRPAHLSPLPRFDWTAIDGYRAEYGPNPHASPNDPRTITVPYEKGMGASLQARGPGTLRLTINGGSVDLSCGPASTITACISDQPVGETWSTWGYGQAEAGLWFDSLPGLVVGQPVTVTVHPSHFVGDDWRIGLKVRPL
jgi:hypothetical protein